jgi:hypothetical protein
MQVFASGKIEPRGPADRLGSIWQVRLSRHARNEMRLYGISFEDVEAVIAAPAAREVDERGNARLIAETGDGRRILVVVAGDDPSFVITVFPRS